MSDAGKIIGVKFTLLEEVMLLLNANSFYSSDGWCAIKLPKHVESQIDAIGEQIGDQFGDVDDRLLEMLKRGQTT